MMNPHFPPSPQTPDDDIPFPSDSANKTPPPIRPPSPPARAPFSAAAVCAIEVVIARQRKNDALPRHSIRHQNI